MRLFETLKSKLIPRPKGKKTAEPLRFSGESKPEEALGGLEMTCTENQGKNLVVASLDSRFTDDMMDYALEMAQRMDYGIIAVNAANLTHDVTEFFSTSHEALFQDFQEAALRNVEPFKQLALKKGLKFAHATKYADIDHAISEVTDECGGIEFIITENPESVPARDSVTPDNRIPQRLCVYAVD